jgi:hypothetical protein
MRGGFKFKLACPICAFYGIMQLFVSQWAIENDGAVSGVAPASVRRIELNQNDGAARFRRRFHER